MVKSFAVVPALLFVACNGADESAPAPSTTPPPVASSEVTVSPSTPPPLGCGDEPADISRTNDVRPGPGVIRGSVTFAQPVKHVLLTFTATVNGSVNVNWLESAPNSPEKTTWTFRFDGLPFEPSGSSYVLTGSSGEALVGSWPGTLESPTPPWNQGRIALTTSSPEQCVTFGVTAPICFKDIGAECETDNECRTTICHCASGLGMEPGVRRKKCDAKKCVAVDCAVLCNAGPSDHGEQTIGGCLE